MRHRSRIAAAALALALAAAGCDLVSSLTPFGVGEREPDASPYSGSWQGSTSAAGAVTFNVVSDEVVDLVLTHRLDCGVVLEIAFTDAILIEDGAFSSDIELDPQGSALLSGRFSSRDSVSASYSFRSLPTSASCENSGAGTFTATKVF